MPRPHVDSWYAASAEPLPPTITSAEYGVYALQAVAVIATFCVGMVLVPSLTNSIFSGHGGQTMISSVPRMLRLR